jgi:hypothetical protein
MQIPQSLQSFPEPAKELFSLVARSQIEKGASESTAMKVAFGVTMGKFEKVNGSFVARSGAFKEVQLYSFKAERAADFVSRSESGNLVHTYVLSDIHPDKEGKAPSASLLQKFANFINDNNPEVDTNHEMFNEISRVNNDNIEAVSRAMSFKKGMAKMVNAVVEAGRLVVNVLFDKRYEKHADSIKGMSLEGAFEYDQTTKTWTDGVPLGATFATEGEPYNPRAVRVA